MTIEHLETLIAFAVVMLGVSLLITILTQMMAAFLGLRGTNLLWGLKTLLKTMDKDLEKHAESVAREVLTHPLISDSTFSRLAAGKPPLSVQRRRVPPFLHSPGLKIAAWITSRWRLASAIRVEELRRMLSLACPRLEEPKQVVEKMLKKTDLEAWFNTAMDRVSQRFALQMRVWTVVFAVIVAFGAHLDAFKLLSQLSSNAELRASLASSAEAMTKKADEVFSNPRGANPSDYVAALEQLKKQYPEAAARLVQPPVFQTPEDAVAWLRSQLGPDGQTERIAKSYQDLVQSVALRNRLDALSTQAAGIKSELSQSRFQLIPEPYPRWPWFPGWPRNRHFWGILVAAALLSLGAPFWFNALKGLSNLRPLLAGKVGNGQDKKAAPTPA